MCPGVAHISHGYKRSLGKDMGGGGVAITPQATYHLLLKKKDIEVTQVSLETTGHAIMNSWKF